jgi:rieske iron-sulfur protein
VPAVGASMISVEAPRRRAILRAGIGLGILGLGRAQENPAALRPKEGDLLVKVDDQKAIPLTPGDIPLASDQTMAWAMDPVDKTIRNGERLNRILLVRFPSEQLSAETRARAAEGVVAYTAICTHAGCEVTDWIVDKQFLFCPCHDSTFEPKDNGKVVDGPAPRVLPALPLKIVEKKLVVAGPFTARIYFEKE